VDFWDVNEMANKIIAVLKHPPLASTLRQHGSFEVRRLSWTDAAKATMGVYDQALAAMR
jgi:glycosyltransferase involved in cell wall biosynthesis